MSLQSPILTVTYRGECSPWYLPVPGPHKLYPRCRSASVGIRNSEVPIDVTASSEPPRLLGSPGSPFGHHRCMVEGSRALQGGVTTACEHASLPPSTDVTGFVSGDRSTPLPRKLKPSHPYRSPRKAVAHSKKVTRHFPCGTHNPMKSHTFAR